jgi:hypothetical protein
MLLLSVRALLVFDTDDEGFEDFVDLETEATFLGLPFLDLIFFLGLVFIMASNAVVVFALDFTFPFLMNCLTAFRKKLGNSFNTKKEK